jgi:hypothetical protein
VNFAKKVNFCEAEREVPLGDGEREDHLGGAAPALNTRFQNGYFMSQSTISWLVLSGIVF